MCQTHKPVQLSVKNNSSIEFVMHKHTKFCAKCVCVLHCRFHAKISYQTTNHASNRASSPWYGMSKHTHSHNLLMLPCYIQYCFHSMRYYNKNDEKKYGYILCRSQNHKANDWRKKKATTTTNSKLPFRKWVKRTTVATEFYLTILFDFCCCCNTQPPK